MANGASGIAACMTTGVFEMAIRVATGGFQFANRRVGTAYRESRRAVCPICCLTEANPPCLIRPCSFLQEGAALPRQNVQEDRVNKTELIEEIAKSADITKASATRALDAMIEAVTATLKKNDSVTLVGFGTFTVGERAARTGRDPRTKEPIKIKAAKVPKFKAGKALKDAVN